MTKTCTRCGDTSAAFCEDWDCHKGWSTEPPSANERAARAIALHARTPGEARLFLAMLGLTSDGRILPDDTRRYDLHESDPLRAVTPTALRVVQG